MWNVAEIYTKFTDEAFFYNISYQWAQNLTDPEFLNYYFFLAHRCLWESGESPKIFPRSMRIPKKVYVLKAFFSFHINTIPCMTKSDNQFLWFLLNEKSGFELDQTVFIVGAGGENGYRYGVERFMSWPPKQLPSCILVISPSQ